MSLPKDFKNWRRMSKWKMGPRSKLSATLAESNNPPASTSQEEKAMRTRTPSPDLLMTTPTMGRMHPSKSNLTQTQNPRTTARMRTRMKISGSW